MGIFVYSIDPIGGSGQLLSEAHGHLGLLRAPNRVATRGCCINGDLDTAARLTNVSNVVMLQCGATAPYSSQQDKASEIFQVYTSPRCLLEMIPWIKNTRKASKSTLLLRSAAVTMPVKGIPSIAAPATVTTQDPCTIPVRPIAQTI